MRREFPPCVCLTFALLVLWAVQSAPATGQSPCPSEPNDVPQQAGQIVSLPYNTTCSISVEGDVDWFRIVLSAGVGYQFDLTSPTDLDTALELYGPGDGDGDPSGPIVAQGDDEVGLNPRIIYVASASGYYFLKAKISDFAFPPDQTGDYTLDIFSYTPDTDDAPTTANQISIPYSGNHEVNPDGDVDWFRVSMTSGFVYDFAAGSASSFDSAFWLYGPGTEDGNDTGPLVATDDDSGGNFQPFLSHTALSNGWYYLRVAFSFNAPSEPNAKRNSSAKTLVDTGPYTLTATSNEPLAVELTAIDAMVIRDGVVRVVWRTASETDNLGFELQMRRTDSQVESAWHRYAFVPAAADAQRGAEYKQDVSGVLPGKYTIRLRIVAADGTFDYSPEVEIRVGTGAGFVVHSVYPNPVASAATLRFAVSARQAVAADLYDVLGRHVSTVFDDVLEADATVTAALQVGSLPAGTYFLQVRGDAFVDVQPVTVTR